MLLLGVLTILAPLASGQDYLNDLSTNLEQASAFLDEAAVTIEECTRGLIACLQDPEDIAGRVDMANQGLQGVTANISAMTAPAEHTASHNLLIEGLDEVTMGLTIYTQGLRENDPSKLVLASEVIRAGQDDIRTATSAIAGQPPPNPSPVGIVTIGVVAAAGGMAVLLVFLLRETHRQRLDHLQKELATCPLCGQVLDGWETYKVKQIRRWQTEHLQSHQEEGEPPPPSDRPSPP